jgi:hypothetical protein
MAPVIINFTARIRIDLCDKGLDPSLLGQELLVMAVFLLGLDTVLVILSFLEIIHKDLRRGRRDLHVSGFGKDLLEKLSRKHHSVSQLSVSYFYRQAQERWK